MKNPVKDRNSTKYPDRVFHRGQWMTQEQIDRRRQWDAANKRAKRRTDPEWASRELEVARRSQRHKYHSDPEWAKQKLEKCRLASRRRVAVLGERHYAPTVQTAELMRQLRDNYKESHG